MKKILLSLMVLLAVSAGALRAQSIDSVMNGLKMGNAVAVANNIADNLLLNVLDKSDNFNKSQALQQLKAFFAANSVKAFDVRHKGDSPTGRYAIGTLTTAQGNYRVSIFMKNEKGKESLKELRFQLIE